VSVKVADTSVTVKGPRGELTRDLPSEVTVEVDAAEARVTLDDATNRGRAMHGLARALLGNMVEGVSTGFKRVLEINGIGYRADLRKGHILFQLGHSHPILFQIPELVEAEVSKDNKVTLVSSDKEALGHAAAKIRSFRPPEPYKGKGIKYADEKLVRKAGKAAAR
jgi:large subunit ribosomal protein L6